MTTGEGAQLLGQGMVIGVALAAPIGPINIEIVRRCLSGGFRHGWLVGVGALSADTLYAILVTTGLTPLADRPALRFPLFLAGALMLAYLAWGSFQTALAQPSAVDAIPRAGRSWITGFLMAALNPLGIVYWLSIGAALIAAAIDAKDVRWAVVYGISNNPRRFWDIEHARELLGYAPEDAAPV